MIDGINNSTQTPQPAKPKSAAEETLSTKDTFLRLLVSQIRNQNPLNPADGVQFLTQLAQFTSLEQSMQMREDIQAIRKALEKPAASPATDSK